jgi:RNA recognition motif-containing protein
MNKKLYVGNLSYDATEEDLQGLFAEVGPVMSVALIKDRSTGQSKGFGFVEMETPDAAQKAIEKYNNFAFKGRNLTVSEARPPKEQGFGGGGGRRDDRRGGGGGGRRSGGGGGGDRDRY